MDVFPTNSPINFNTQLPRSTPQLYQDPLHLTSAYEETIENLQHLGNDKQEEIENLKQEIENLKREYTNVVQPINVQIEKFDKHVKLER